MTDKVASLTSQLHVARRLLEQLSGQRDIYIKTAENRHWTELDSATGSGIRRKPNPKADAARFGRFDREAAVFAEFEATQKRVAVLESRLAAAVKDRDRVRLTRDDIVGARAIREASGWRAVVRVNKTTVSVATGYSWTDRIPFDKVIEVRREQ